MTDPKPDTPLERLQYCISDPGAARLVAAHFDPDNEFEGELFNTLGNNPPYEFSNDDLLALTCLDEHVPPKSLRRSFSGEGRSELEEHLRAIPPEACIEDFDAPLEAAKRMWTLLAEANNPDDENQKLYPGIGPVNATKLMARKRPALVPIVDSVVRAVVDAPGCGDRPDCHWNTYQDFMRHGASGEQVARLREAAGVHFRDIDLISDLRLVDIAVWMRGSGSKSACRVRDDLRVDDLPWVSRPKRAQ